MNDLAFNLLKSSMQECGFWQRYNLEGRSREFITHMIKMHSFCREHRG